MQHMASLVPLEFPTSLWRSEQWRQILPLRQEEYRDVSSSRMQFVFGIYQYPTAALLYFDHIWT